MDNQDDPFAQYPTVAPPSNQANASDGNGPDDPFAQYPTYNSANQPSQGILSHVAQGEEPTGSAAAKIVGTGVLQGLSSIPGSAGDLSNIYDLANQYIQKGAAYSLDKLGLLPQGKTYEDLLRAINEEEEKAKNPAQKAGLVNTVYGVPVPTTKGIMSLIAPYTGEYQPETPLGENVMSGISMAAGLPGVAGKVKALTTAGKIAEKSAQAALAYLSGHAASAVGQATDSPFAALATGAIAPLMTHGAINTVGKYTAPMFKGNVQTLADAKLASFSDDPEQVALNIAKGTSPTMPMTSGEASLDPGLLKAQKAVRTANPEFDTRMKDIEGQQNIAAHGAVESLRPDGANVMAPSEFLSKKLADINDMTSEALPSSVTPEQTGEQLRTVVSDKAEAAQKAISDIYNSIPNDRNIVTTGLKKDIGKVQKSIGTLAEPASPAEQSIFYRAKKIEDVTKYSDLIDYDKSISKAMSDELRNNGKTVVYNRLNQIKSATMDAINNAIDNQHNWEQAALAEGKITPDNTIASKIDQHTEGTDAPTVSNTPVHSNDNLNDYTIFHPSGSIKARYELASLNDITPSHTNDFTPNPSFPQELQPRDRSSIPAQDQVNKMASGIQPERLGPSHEANTGAPIVGPDGVVESGNGRTIALSKAYDAGKADNYVKWLSDQGFDTTGVDKPILVARRTSELTPAERVNLTESANKPVGLNMSPTEQARSDAKTLAGLGEPPQYGDLTSGANAPFVKAFASKLSPAERGSFIDKNGNLSPDGERRLSAALMEHAYSDPTITHRAFGTTDNNIKNISGALNDASGPWSEMRRAAAAGEIDAAHDITPKLTAAVNLIMRARDEGKPLGFYLNQHDMFAPETDALVKQILSPDGHTIASRPKIAEALKNYAEAAQQNTNAPRLFGEAMGPDEILRSSINKAKETPGPITPQAERNTAPPVIEKQLTPNMTQEDADALALGKKLHAEKAQTYDQGPVSNVLKTYGYKGQYKTSDGAVASSAFVPGNKGYETVKAFMKAADNDPAAIESMQNIAMINLRDSIKNEGRLTPKILNAWKAQYGNSLRALDEVSPGFSKKFDSLAKANQAIEGLPVKMAMAAGPDEVRNLIGSVFESGQGLTKANQLMRSIADDQHSIDGVRSASVDYMIKKASNAAQAGGEDVLSYAKLKTLIGSNQDVLTAIHGKDGVKNMNALANDMKRVQAARDMMATKGGSDTTKNIIQWAKESAPTVTGHTVNGLIALEAFDQLAKGDYKSAALATSAFAAKKLIDTFKSKNIKNINDLVHEGLLNPDVGSAMLTRAIDRQGRLKEESIMRLNRALLASAQATAQQDERKHRKSGGRIKSGHQHLVDRLMRLAEKAKIAENDNTKGILNVPDDAVARALSIAKKAI